MDHCSDPRGLYSCSYYLTVQNGKKMTVSSLTLIYSSDFPCERLFLFDRSNLRQNFWVRAVIALFCLRSCATRKRANGLCFASSAEETLPYSIVYFVFRSRYSTVLSCYIHQLFFSTSKQIRRGERQRESRALLLFLCQSARGKLNQFENHCGVLETAVSEKQLVWTW